MIVKLDDVCRRIYAGGDVPKDRFSDKKTDIYNIPIYANAEANQGLYGYTDEAREFEPAVTVAARGTIGYSAIRTPPFLPVVRLITVVPDESVITLRYLYYALKHYQPKSSGTSIPQLTVPNIKKYSFNLYDINKQEIVTDNLDKLQSIIAHRKQQLAKLDELVKARFVEMFGDHQEEQKGILIDELCDMVTVGIANAATHAYAESGVLMFRNLNIRENLLDDTDLIYIKPEFAAKYISKALKYNDILVTRTGYPGQACLVPEKYEGAQTFTTLIVRLKENKNLLPSFVCHYINSPFGKRFVKRHQAGVAQQNFGATAMGKMPIVIPAIEMQKAFVSFAEQTDKSKVAVQKALDEAQLLFDSLMQEYFG